MTQVEFFHNARDKIAVACKLIGHLYGQGRRVLVRAPDETSAMQIDRALWTQPAISFVPHVRAGSPLEPETPVIIADSLDVARQDDVLVNLGGELPPSFSRFERLIEIVAADDADRVPARVRFKFYRDRGYPLSAQDCARL